MPVTVHSGGRVVISSSKASELEAIGGGGFNPRGRSKPAPPKAAVPPGERGFSGTQNYKQIVAECQRTGILWEDPEFPADDKTIFFSKAPPRPFEWKRPAEICSDPQLLVGGASRFDVQQGELGDCWLLAAVASLSMHKDLIAKVVPLDQTFQKEKGYCGIFHFQFWQYGEWVDVCVDDRLPTYYGRLTFMHSAENNEFWTPLLEKAYAKLSGSYESLKGGSQSEAMEDFTGGVTEFFDFRKEVPPNLFTIMSKANARSSLMGCSIEAVPGQTEAELPNGLICGHAYSVTGITKADVKTPRFSGQVELVRVRNPWGNEAEWKGAWSDKSPEWTCVNEAERKRLGLSFDDDGEFWMSFKDFTSNFQRVEICNLGPDSIEDDMDSKGKKRWESINQMGAWKKRVTAGGCRNFIDTFHTNPQFRVNVVDADDEDDEDKGTLIVGLMQKGRRKKREEGLDLLTMGYAIYKTPDDMATGTGGTLDKRFFQTNASVARSPSFINLREVTGRHKLTPGEYVILPSTFNPNEEGEFLLRIFSEKKNDGGEMDEETGMVDVEAKDGDNVDNGGPPKDLSPQTDAQTEALKKAFQQIAGEDMEIDAYELKDILNAAFMKEFNFDGFSIETTRSMVALMDLDHSGKLGFEEFRALWDDIRLWKTAFKKYDKDNSGTFNSHELRECCRSIGYRLSNATFWSIVMRYARKDGTIEFDDFVLCCVRLKTIFDTFRAMDKGGKIEFTLDEFIKTCIYT